MSKGNQLIDFRGTQVTPGWLEKLLDNQRWGTLLHSRHRKKGEGREVQRICFGEERYDKAEVPSTVIICHDCQAKVGEYHVLGCDVEQCPNCRHQLMGCTCFDLEKNLSSAREIGLTI